MSQLVSLGLLQGLPQRFRVQGQPQQREGGYPRPLCPMSSHGNQDKDDFVITSRGVPRPSESIHPYHPFTTHPLTLHLLSMPLTCLENPDHVDSQVSVARQRSVEWAVSA